MMVESDEQSHFEMVLSVLERLGSQCNYFLANLNKFNDSSCLSSVSFAIQGLPVGNIGGEKPNRSQLERAAYKIADFLTWEFFASRIRKLDHKFAIFRQGDPLLNTDVEFVKLNIPCKLPSSITGTPSYKRAQYARKLEKIEQVPIAVENVVDDDLLPPSFSYVKANLYSDAIPKSALEPVVECQCAAGVCSESSNCCPKMAGIDDFPYLSRPMAANTLRNVDRTQAIYECTSLCKCAATCPNRVVQNGLRIPLLLFKTRNNCGWGLKTLTRLKQGQFVIEFCGEVVESDKLAQSSLQFTFALDFNIERIAKYFIDAGRYGNLARFINSRCMDANLVAHAVYVDCIDESLPRIAFFAKRDVEVGEELTFDYFDGLAQSGQMCLCQSPHCRQKPVVPKNEPSKLAITDTPRKSRSRSSDFFSLSNGSSSKKSRRSHKRKLDDSGFQGLKPASKLSPRYGADLADDEVVLISSDEEELSKSNIFDKMARNSIKEEQIIAVKSMNSRENITSPFVVVISSDSESD